MSSTNVYLDRNGGYPNDRNVNTFRNVHRLWWRSFEYIAAGSIACILFFSPLLAASVDAGISMAWAEVIFLSAALYFLANPNPILSNLWGIKSFVGSVALLLTFVFWQVLPPTFSDRFQTIELSQTAMLIPSKSFAPFGTILGTFRIASYAVFFLTVLSLTQRASYGRIFSYVVFASVVTQALVALVSLRFLGDTMLGYAKTAYSGAATGTFVGKNGLATFLAMGLLFSVPFLFPKTNPQSTKRINFDLQTGINFVGCLFILAALLCTQSRMGVACAIAGAGVLFSRKYARETLTILLGVLVLTLLFGRNLLERFAAASADIQVRTELYEQIIGMIQVRPWTGFGLDSFPLAFEIFHRPPVSSEVVWDKAHSTYLSLWVELGIFAGSIPIILGVVVAVRLRAIHHNKPNPFAIGALAALIMAGTHSLVDFSLEIPANAFLLLTIIAIGLSADANNSAKLIKKTGA